MSACEPDNDFSKRAKLFAGLHVNRPVENFVHNLDSRVEVVRAGNVLIPVTVNNGIHENAWICSPRATYTDCALEEAERYLPSWAARGGRGLSRHFGRQLTVAGVDRVVAVNNWLLSTNIYPPLNEVEFPALIETVRKRWPDHAIWFRSLNLADNADWIEALRMFDFQLLLSRQVYLYEDLAALSRGHANLTRDLQQLNKTVLSRVRNEDITLADYDRIATLYEMLYIEKYSRFNPHYTASFMRDWHRAGLLEFHGFRDDCGVLQCVAGLFQQGRIVTAPIVGYNTALPQKLGLYRLLTACVYEITLQRDGRLNFSAGASGFKRLRGGSPALEFSAVYAHHLGLRTRAAITSLSVLTRRIGAPLLARYQL